MSRTEEDGPRRTGPRPWRRALEAVLTIAAVATLLAGAVAASRWIKESEPVAQREAATRRSAALVETVVAKRGTFRPVIRVLGSVQPAREIVLSPRVGGEIVAVEPAFRPGGVVEAGEPLLFLDPEDYIQNLVIRESEVGQVEAELEIEEGRQRVAELEFKLLGEGIDRANRSLVLREPQIASLRSRLRAAKASVDQAVLDLGRTEIVAPFDAQILERFTELGSQVARGDRLARLVGIGEYWVTATVPLGSLRWIHFPRDGEPGARARIRHRSVWPEGQHREGTVERLIGEVDPSTRLARVIVSVEDPLGGNGAPPLILGTVVQVEIEAVPLENVVRLERAYLRQNDTVWVMDGDVLRIRKAKVAFSNATHAFLREGVEHDEKVVTTDLATVVDGLPIREASPASGPAADGARGAGAGGPAPAEETKR
jgi:RND family efflux transporter MFP subunit